MKVKVACANLLVHPEPSQLTQGVGFLVRGEVFSVMGAARAEFLDWVQIGDGKHRGKWCVRSIQDKECLVEV